MYIQSIFICTLGEEFHIQWARDHIIKRFSCDILQGISRGPPPSYEEAVDPNGEVNYHYFFLSQHEIT